uniref:ATP synthase F0 subunit 8 n=1 Tax=Charinus ferreus TaxID=3034938 RepID=UPI002410E77A|nr:ATP synthase F0 subunit 8 [Charinus ferreus]WEM34686.1 ATP synthase subunit 8 [Charinus ferreus]WEM34699.1 ATP synthase subunit 8 [Charinus ferreus]WEM34712.1 ATP synthase subunit 8 [Charinus ferreus]
MPQMAPLNWLLLPTTAILTILIITTLIASLPHSYITSLPTPNHKANPTWKW